MADPALEGPEGVVARQKLLDNGFKPDEVSQWEAGKQKEQFEAGWDPKDIDAYWGNAPKDMTSAQGLIEHTFSALGDGDKARIAQNPWEIFRAGLQTSDVVIPFGKPTILPPGHAGLASNILYRFGQGVGDIPGTVLGWMGGALAGAPVGAAAGGAMGSAVGPEGTAGGAAAGSVVGGLIGAGAGGAALPEAWRRVWMEHQAGAGGYKSWGELWAHAADIMKDVGTQAVIGGAAAPFGPLAGKVAAPLGGVAERIANTVGMAGAATAVGAAVDGHVPTTDDIVSASVLALTMHGAGEFVGATKRFVPSDRSQVVQANLRDTYVATGRNPMTVAQIAMQDVAVQSEVMGPTAADGTRITPALDALKLPEPTPFKTPEGPVEEATPPVVEPATAASADVENENGLTHEEQALADKANHGALLTPDEFDQHLKLFTDKPAYLDYLNKQAAEENKKFETETSPTLELQGDKDWTPEPVGHINEPMLIEPLPAQPTDEQKAMFHIDPVDRKNVAWSESQQQWVEPHNMTKSDWKHLQALVEPKIGVAEKEPTSWWHGSTNENPSLDPRHSNQGVSAVWVASSRAIASGFSGAHSSIKTGTLSRVHIAAGKYFDFRDPSQRADFEQWMLDQKMHPLDVDSFKGRIERGQYTTMENATVQRFLKERGYEGYFERETGQTPVNLAVYDKAKIIRDESGPSPVKRQMIRLQAEQANAENYTEPGSLLSVYGAGERMTPEEEAAAKNDIVAGKMGPPGGGGKPPSDGGALGPHQPEGEPPEPMTWQEARDKLVGLIAPEVKKGFLPDWANPRKWLADWQGQLTPARSLDRALDIDPKGMGVEDFARQTYASSGRVNEFFRLGSLRITDPVKWTLARVNSASKAGAYRAVKEDGGNVVDFTSIRMALRTLEKAQQGIDIHPVMTPELASARLQEPGWQEKYGRGLRIMKEHTDGVVNYAQDAHLFSPALAEAMKANNQVHINLRRVVDPNYKPGGAGRSTVFNPVKKLMGGNHQFTDIVSSDFENTNAIITMADRNLSRLNIIDTINGRPTDLQRLGYDGFSKIEAKDLDTDALLQGHLVDEEGTPLTDKEKEGMLPFLAQRKFNEQANARKGNFLIFRNGKPEVYHTDNPDLQAVLSMEHHGTPAAIFQFAIKMAGLERAGIIGSPGFLLRSLTHQQMASSVTGQSNRVPFLNMWKGLMPEMLGGVGKDAWEEAAAQGVGQESAMGILDKDPLLNKVTSTFDQAGTWSSIMNMARHPFDAWRALSNRLHQASSVAGYQRLKLQGYDPAKAAMIARTDYLDHAEPLAASYANTFARMTPFMSTGLKDIEQLGRALQDRPLSTIANGLIKLTLPTLALSYVNAQVDKTLPPGSRYSDLPEWRRLLFWNIPVAGVHIAIPKPYAVGFLFAGLPQMLMEHIRDNSPADFHAIGGALVKQMLPPAIPTAAGPVLDNLTNTHFPSSVPLVPSSLADVTNWMQYKPDTSGAARKLTQIMGPAGLGGPNISPIVLDNYIQKWGGTLAMQVFRALDAPWRDPGAPKTWADNPLFGSFIARNPGAHSQVIEDLFDKMHEFEMAHASLKLAERRMNPEEVAASRTAQALDTISNVKTSIRRQMAAINAVNASKTLTDEEKTKRGDQMSSYLVQSAERGMAYLKRVAP